MDKNFWVVDVFAGENGKTSKVEYTCPVCGNVSEIYPKNGFCKKCGKSSNDTAVYKAKFLFNF